MAKHTSSHRDINKIKKICSKVAKNYESDIIISYGSKYDSSLSSDSKWDIIQPAEWKVMDKPENVLTYNIKI